MKAADRAALLKARYKAKFGWKAYEAAPKAPKGRRHGSGRHFPLYSFAVTYHGPVQKWVLDPDPARKKPLGKKNARGESPLTRVSRRWALGRRWWLDDEARERFERFSDKLHAI